jgi:hypothetical protein
MLRSSWPIPLHADRRSKPLDLNVICGRDSFSWELTGKEEDNGSSTVGITGEGLRRLLRWRGGGQWAAVCDDHGGVLGDVTFFLYRWLLADEGGDSAQTRTKNSSVSVALRERRRGDGGAVGRGEGSRGKKGGWGRPRSRARAWFNPAAAVELNSS